MAEVLELFDSEGVKYLYDTSTKVLEKYIEPLPPIEIVKPKISNRLSSIEKFSIVVANDLEIMEKEYLQKIEDIKQDLSIFDNVEVDREIALSISRLRYAYYLKTKERLVDDAILGKADDGILLNFPFDKTKIVSAWGNDLGYKKADLHVGLLEPIYALKVVIEDDGRWGYYQKYIAPQAAIYEMQSVGVDENNNEIFEQILIKEEVLEVLESGIKKPFKIILKLTKIVQDITRGVLNVNGTRYEEEIVTLEVEERDNVLCLCETVQGSYDYVEVVDVVGGNSEILPDMMIINFWRI